MTVREDVPAEGVLRITLDEPATKNALSPDVMNLLDRSLERLAADPEARVGVLTGAGDVFCSGGDTRRMGAARPTPWEKRTYLEAGIGRLARSFLRLDKPIIALVNGPAVGAGMDLALWCDFRWGSPEAYFLPGFVDLGVTPGFGGAVHLTRLLGHSGALDILLTGRRIAATEAAELGLLRCVEPTRQALMDEGLRFASELAAKSSPAVRATKRLIQRESFAGVLEHLDLAWSSFALLQETPEHEQAVARLRHRRKATSEQQEAAHHPPQLEDT
jgi:enoyl-CoA hydratase/carnithine racemase